jgi:hypothetical protein
MATAPRPKGKAKKIAEKIMGKPANRQTKITKEEQRVRERLLFEETSRVR